MYANVLIVETPGNIDQIYTYAIPAGMKVEVGAMVLVPLRRRNCKGIVLSVQETRPVFDHKSSPKSAGKGSASLSNDGKKESEEQESKVKEIRIREIKQVFAGPSMATPAALELAHWMADYYVCSLQKVIQLFLPPPVRVKEKLVYLFNPVRVGSVEEKLLPEAERRILELLRPKGTGAAGLTASEIKRKMGQAVEQELANLVTQQYLTVEIVYEPRVTPKKETMFRLKPSASVVPENPENPENSEHPQNLENAEQSGNAGSAKDGGPLELLKRAPRQQAIFNLLQEQPHSLTELKEKGVYKPDAIKALIDKGLIEKFEQGIERIPYGGQIEVSRPRFLNAAQQEACQTLCGSLAGQSRCKWLLYGVTGSGKTEVYLRVMEEALKQGKQVLYLVPEIALASQVIIQLLAAFGEQVAVLHSALAEGERYDQWRKIKEGRAKVVLGPRSAVFAPFSKLGLIIIDEEHENTYKQNEPDPRYDARTVAEKMAELTGAVLVLGSATPSLRTFYAASQGKYGLLKLAGRVGSRLLPHIEIIDMKRERLEGNSGLFSAKLLAALRQTIEAGEQAILFINRRGFHTYVMCRECGKPLLCPRCNITLNYHRAKGKLVCHYCNFVRALPRNCPFCGSTYVRYYGTGTERVAEELRRFFPELPFIRMDTDTTQRKDSHFQMLQAFREGRAKVLIGTQMIAKGLDFPQVTMVGILNPDFLLNMPDYQAGERAFQLMTQVAGRAGRGEEPGNVYIQTYDPEHYLFAAVLKQDYEEFYRQEIANRQMLQYPPFTYLARILASGYNEKQVQERIAYWAALLEKQLAEEKTVEILGPGPAPIDFLKKRYRYHIIIKSTELVPVQKLASLVREKALTLGGEIRTIIDVEPQSLL